MKIATHLSAALPATSTVLPLESCEGIERYQYVMVGDECVLYWKDCSVVRGQRHPFLGHMTDVVDHPEGEAVYSL